MTLFEIIRQKVETIRNTDRIYPLDAVERIINEPASKDDIIGITKILGIEANEITLNEALNSYKNELLRVQQIKDGDFANPTMRNGYVLSESADNCFGNYFRGLRERNLAEDDLTRILDECNIIVQQFLPQPTQNPDRRGLVIGQVQSGKTTIFNGLISAAADIGFNVIIILSGTIESLRRQTQSRITSDVTATWGVNPTNPFYFTWISNHSGPGMTVAGNAGQVLTELGNPNRRQVALGVFLKNGNVLNKLRRWLSTINPMHLSNLRVLIIDDEADQATPNAGIRRETVTRINQNIKDLVIPNQINNCPTQGRTTYLGFTATPFANLLNEAGNNTLYPKDFLYFLKSSSKYYGPWQLFGNPDEVEGEETIIPLDAIRLLDDNDINGTVPAGGEEYAPELTEGLRNAIFWYILASAAIRCSDKAAWSTMLIHTGSKTADHQSLWTVVNGFIIELKENNRWRTYLQELMTLWDEEIRKVPEDDFRLAFPNYGKNPNPYPSWDDLQRELPHIINNITVKIDNSLYAGDERMQFDEDIPVRDRLQIGIGGNTLSRGITLKNLVSSYFARRASSYDTLLQMGRWFGYRVGYEMLPRLWTTPFLAEAFRDLVIMEQNLRDQMNVYLGGESPAGKAPVITQMPAMAITRRSVIGNIQIGDVNYDGTAPQTILFNNSNEWLQNNFNTAMTLLNSIGSYERKNPPQMNNRIFFDDVPLANVINFLEGYNILPERNVFNKDHIISFIQNNKQNYDLWTVVVIGGSSSNKFEFGNMLSVIKNNRTRIIDEADSGNTKINLKSLRSTNELLADRPDLLQTAVNKEKATLWALRRENNLNPVLIIYPIDKDSIGNPPLASNRASLKDYAVNDIIGLSVILNPPDTRAVQGASLADIQEAYQNGDDDQNPDEMDLN
jgi:hypothetical protein